MITQRWREGRSSYRPAGETINTRLYEVAAIADDNGPKRFVQEHHYSGSFPAARFRYGLYKHDALSGVAIFSHPCNDKVLSVFPGDRLESTELGRFVLLDEVPGNGETWFLSRCFELLRRLGLVGVVSFSDPAPRTKLDGDVVMRGHVGTIYQAHNAVYIGRGTPRLLRILPDGRTFSDRAAQKIRRREQGWKYSARILESFGATPLTEDENSTEWLNRWVPFLTRPLRHRGNHKFIWALQSQVRRHLPKGEPYPKQIDKEGTTANA